MRPVQVAQDQGMSYPSHPQHATADDTLTGSSATIKDLVRHVSQLAPSAMIGVPAWSLLRPKGCHRLRSSICRLSWLLSLRLRSTTLTPCWRAMVLQPPVQQALLGHTCQLVNGIAVRHIRTRPCSATRTETSNMRARRVVSRSSSTSVAGPTVQPQTREGRQMTGRSRQSSMTTCTRERPTWSGKAIMTTIPWRM